MSLGIMQRYLQRKYIDAARYYSGERLKFSAGLLANKTDANMFFRYYFLIILAAMPGVGKSAWCKDIIVKLSRKRRVVIFDYKNEWGTDLIEYNASSRNPSKMLNVRVIRNYSLRLSQMTLEMWESLGFDPKSKSISARLLYQLSSRLVPFHQDDPKLFEKLLLDLPTRLSEVEDFNAAYEAYDFAIAHPVLSASYGSIMNRWSVNKSLFFDPANPGDKCNFTDDEIRKLLMRHNLIFQMDLSGPEEVYYASMVVGKLMSTFLPILPILHPAVVVEEADNLFGQDESMLSVREGIKYVKKYRKFGASLILISQQTSDFNSKMTHHVSQIVVGKLLRQDPYHAASQHWTKNTDLDRNVRPLYLIDNVNGNRVGFYPYHPRCKA